MAHRRVSLSKPTHVNSDVEAKEPNMDCVTPAPIANIASMRLQLTTLPMSTSLRPAMKQRTQSAPHPKFVRFDQKLEHVRLFLKAQTPSAVKADPILDLEDDQANGVQLRYPNWPTKIHGANDMISIESIALASDQKSLVGKCKVNNIAFNKQVTVRYTFNYWQDVTEIQAAYRESIGRESSNTDRFMFNIPLNDRMEKSSQETMYFCLKYTVNGTDYWDSNDGLNYQLELFKGTASKAVTIDDLDGDLVVPKAKFGKRAPALSSSPTFDFPSKPSQKKPLGSRYDFSASLSAAAQTQPIRTFRPSPPSRIQSFPSYFGAMDESTHRIPPPASMAYNTGYSTLKQEGFVTNKSPASPQTISNPIPIQARPAANSPSYFDLVNKYCFYGSDSPLSRSPNSTPVIPC
jgi:Carbohydrate/starch-binding module (family 21)